MTKLLYEVYTVGQGRREHAYGNKDNQEMQLGRSRIPVEYSRFKCLHIRKEKFDVNRVAVSGNEP
jgi:hypothetical protein